MVVGSGPNGLAAAITIAHAGRSVLVLEAKNTIGGGTRTEGLTLPGFRHDVCSAIHPWRSCLHSSVHLISGLVGLSGSNRRYRWHTHWTMNRQCFSNVQWRQRPKSSVSTRAAIVACIGPAVRDWTRIVPELLKPLGIPRTPFPLMRFGLRAMRSAVGLARSWFKGVRAQALFAGNAAHAIFPLQHLSSAGFGLMLSMSGHAVGWPIARGGSQAIADALASYLISLGGEVEVGVNVSSTSDLPRARALFSMLHLGNLLRSPAQTFPRTM